MERKLLAIDDDPSFLTLIASAFSDIGWNVTCAERLSDAHEELKKNSYDLIAVDGLLPDGPGIRFLEEIRSAGDHSRAVFITAFWRDDESFRRLAYQLGVLRLLHKPLTAAQLLIQLEPILNEITPGFELPDRIADQEPAKPVEEVTESEPASALDKLQASFRAKLPERWAAVEEGLEKAAQYPDDRDALYAAMRLAHNLYGTAGSYGVTETADVARTIESVLTGMLDGKDLGDESWTELRELVRQQLVRHGASGVSVACARETKTRDRAMSTVIAEVIVVSRDDKIIESIKEIGRRHMIAARPARSLEEARDLLGTGPFDGVVLDLETAELIETLKLAEEIRTFEGMARASVICLSQDDSIEMRIETANSGVSLFLVKPLKEDDLVAGIRFLGRAGDHEAPRVLVVDGGLELSSQVEEVLGFIGARVSVLTKPERILMALDAVEPDLLILEVQLPTIGGVDVCKVLRATKEWQKLPIMFISDRSDPTTRLACFESGADEYVVRPIVAEELITRATAWIERHRQQRDHGRHHPVSRLLTRTAFLDQTEHRLTRAQSLGEHLALGMIEIEAFDRIGQQHGFRECDQILESIGDYLIASSRSTDIRGHWSDGQFSIVLYGSSAEVAAGVLGRMGDELSQIQFTNKAGESFQLNTRLGFAAFPETGRTVDDLIDQALRAVRTVRSR